MKTSKAMTLALMGAFLLGPPIVINAQDIRYDDSDFQLKSPGKAQALSSLSTAVPVFAGSVWAINSGMGAAQIALIGSGIVVGPSVGYFYGGCSKKGISGAIIRLGTGAFTAFAVGSIKDKERNENAGLLDFDMGPIIRYAVGVVGCSVVLIQAVSDMARVRSAVEERNESLACQNGIKVSLSPIFFADSGAGGLELQVTF